jgi:Na+/H+-dicarboxylate symporter
MHRIHPVSNSSFEINIPSNDRITTTVGLALLFGEGRFTPKARALINLIGNGVATATVARWAGSLDRAPVAGIEPGVDLKPSGA